MAMQSPDIPFTLWIHKSKMDGQDEFVTQIKHREDGGLDFNMPNFTAFKHRLETGPIQYNEKTDELWYVDPETHAEVHIVDQQSLEIGIRKALGEGRLGLAVNVAKKQVCKLRLPLVSVWRATAT